MPPDPTPAARPGFWTRRRIRRITYLIASGAALAGLAVWAAQRPAVDRWLVGRMDAYCRQEFGVGVRAERLELHPFQGRILVHGLALGGDLLQARLLELDLEWASLLHTPHIRSILLDTPVLNLDPQRLAVIRIRPHPPRATNPQVHLDRLEIRNGLAHVQEPAWGLPRADFHFQATGKGWAPNQLAVALRLPGITLGTGPGAFQGTLEADADVTDQRLALHRASLRLGGNQLDAAGQYDYRSGQLSATAGGRLDLAQAERLLDAQRLLAAPKQAAASGSVDFQAKADGTLDRLAWSGSAQGRELQARGVPLHPGRLQLAARGGSAGIRLDKLDWQSQEGRLQAQGDWTAKAGCTLKLDASGINLAPVAGYTHTGFLKDLTARFSGEARLPMAGLPKAMPGLDQLVFHGSGQFLQAGQPVGGITVDLARSRFQAGALALELPELQLHGSATGTLDAKGLGAVAAEADLATHAADVAGVLKAWDIGMADEHGKLAAYDMDGRTQAHAKVSWARRDGLQLSGQVTIADPRWHGASADQLKADVSIDRDVLKVSDIELDKGEGHGWGDFRLTWADLPAGADQIDMCYRASRLPIREGLKAADLGDLPLDGTGSGWTRLHGPFSRIMMEGQGVAEQGEVFGLRVPAASADFFYDLSLNRLRTTDVRIADSLEHLRPAEAAPTGPLALQGAMDMDVDHATWVVDLQGAVDSKVLGLPGPSFQARARAHLDGPFTAPLGPIQLPTGTLAFSEGRVTQGDQSLDGLAGTGSFRAGNLDLRLGLAGKPVELLTVEASQQGPDHLAGTVAVEVGPDSADTAQLAARLTQNFLKDAHLRFHAQGDWGPRGLQWQGQMDRFNGQFEGFHLAQSHPGQFSGDLSGMDLAMALDGRASATLDETPSAGRPPSGQGIQRRGRAPSATSLSLSGRVPFAPDGKLALELAGSSNLANLKTILDRVVQPGQYSLLADLHPEGSARYDLNLGGTLGETTLDGSLTLKAGRAVVHGYPLSIENLDFTAQFRGRDILIPKTAPLRGTLAQGALTAWGKLTWQLGGISSYDLHTSLEDFQFRDLPEGFELQGSLDATLKGSDRDGGQLKGTVWAKRTHYRTEINLTDLILAGALGGTGGLATLDPTDPLARIDLDLEVHMTEPWDLDTNLLKLQGRPAGPFSIRGNLVQPGLKGKMELLPGGRLTNLFPAGDIILERGSVEFPDPGFFNPIIDLQGEIDIPPYLVSLTISGPLDALQAKPFSTPTLRQDEIFAILIDPAAVATVGGAPGASTQTALTTGLASASTGLLTSLALANFQDQLRKTLNLDRVSVALRTGVGQPDTSIVVGKSLNLFGYRTPLVFTHDKAGEVTTISGQMEWRFGDFVLRLGASQSTSDSMAPSGEIRHSWSPK